MKLINFHLEVSKLIVVQQTSQRDKKHMFRVYTHPVPLQTRRPRCTWKSSGSLKHWTAFSVICEMCKQNTSWGCILSSLNERQRTQCLQLKMLCVWFWGSHTVKRESFMSTLIIKQAEKLYKYPETQLVFRNCVSKQPVTTSVTLWCHNYTVTAVSISLNKAEVKKQHQGWWENVVGGASSGLWELTNQSRLDFPEALNRH